MPPKMDIFSFLALWFNNLRKNTFKVEVINTSKQDNGSDKVVSAIENSTNPVVSAITTAIAIFKKHTFRVEVSNLSQSDDSGIRESLESVRRAIKDIPQLPNEIRISNFPETPKLVIPKEIQVSGTVAVSNLPKVQEVKGDLNLKEGAGILKGLQIVVDAINDLKLETAQSFKGFGTVIATSSGQGATKLTDGTKNVTITTSGEKKGLDVNVISGSTSGTEYTEGDTDSTITGLAILWEDTSDTLRAVSAAKPLPVNIVAGGAGDGAILDGVSSSIKATVLDYINSNPLAVRLSDTNGDYVAAGAGTQYTEDAAAAANPVGGAIIVVRDDARGGSLTTTDGDNVALRGTNAGELYVKHVDSIPVTQSGTWNITNISGTVSLPTGAATSAKQDTGNTSLSNIDSDTSAIQTSVELIDDAIKADDAAFTPATTKVMMAGFEFDDTLPDSVDEGDAGAARMSARREVYVQLRDAAGNERGLNIDASGQIAVTNAGITTIAGAVSGTEMQVDVLTMPSVAVTNGGLTELAAAINASSQMDINIAASAVDVMLGTDFSGVFGTASLVLATQADDIANTVDGIQTSSFLYVFDGTTWDRLRGDSTNGMLVNLGSNNDVTVTGTVAVTQSGTWDEVGINDSGNSITVDAPVGTPVFVRLSDGASAISTLPVSLASVPSHAVTNAGTFAVQVDGSALTALQLIDDVVYVDDADWTADTSKHALVGSVTQVAPTANTDGDTTPLISDALRQLRMAAPESDLATAGTSHVKKYYTNAGAVTDGIIWSPAAGKRWYLTLLYINVSAAATVTVEDDLAAGDSAVWKGELAANSGVVLPFGDVPMFSGEDAADLLITTSAGNVYVTAVGYEV